MLETSLLVITISTLGSSLPGPDFTPWLFNLMKYAGAAYLKLAKALI